MDHVGAQHSGTELSGVIRNHINDLINQVNAIERPLEVARRRSRCCRSVVYGPSAISCLPQSRYDLFLRDSDFLSRYRR